MNFLVVDTESNTWYGTDPADKTKVSAEAGHWNFWIDSDKTGIYDIQIDLVNMRWSHTYNEHASSDIHCIEMPHESSLVFDIYGRPVSTIHHGVDDGQKKKRLQFGTSPSLLSKIILVVPYGVEP